MTLEEKEKLFHLANTSGFKLKQDIISYLSDIPETEEEKPKGNKTSQQLKAGWLYITQKFTQLNDSGLDQRKVLKQEINIPWTKEAFHDKIWIPVQKAMYGTDSMKDLKKDQLEPIHKVIERELGEKHGAEYIPFPNDEIRALEDMKSYKLSATEVKDHLAEYYENEDVKTAFD